MKARLLLFLCSATTILKSGTTNTDSISYYSIPEPNIIAFEGGGLRVILKDDSGISLLRFHANVNEEMKQLYQGTINIESTQKVNGKWILEDRRVQLNVGDVIYYWLFVEKNRLGYVKQPVRYKIRNLIPYFAEYNNNEEVTPYQPQHTQPPFMSTTSRTTMTETIPVFSPGTTDVITLQSLQRQIDALNTKLELLTSITALQGQVDILSKKFDGLYNSGNPTVDTRNVSKTVEFILQTLETLPEAKRLTLSGTIPPDQLMNSPEEVVRFVISEKLDLKVNVVTAVRKSDNTIVFELKTLREKLDVLNAAQEKLKGTRILIS